MTPFDLVSIIVIAIALCALVSACVKSFKRPTKEELAPFEEAHKQCIAKYNVGDSVYFINQDGNEHMYPDVVKEIEIDYPYGVSSKGKLLWNGEKFARKVN